MSGPEDFEVKNRLAVRFIIGAETDTADVRAMAGVRGERTPRRWLNRLNRERL